MGVALASQDKVDIGENVELAEHLRTLLISVLFVLLTVRIDWSDLRDASLTWGIFVLLLIVVVRPVSVVLSTWRTQLNWRERAFLAGMAPRGIVAAAMASVFALRLDETGHQGADNLLPITFLTVAPDEEANSLAVQEFRGTFGVNNLSQVTCEDSFRVRNARRNAPERALGVTFSPNADYDELERWALRGQLTVTPITKALSFEGFGQMHPERALSLMAINAEEIPRIVHGEDDFPVAGEKVLSFVLPSE